MRNRTVVALSSRAGRVTLACAAAAVIGAVAVPGPASATNYGTELFAGETLFANDYIKNGALKLIMQTDGNLVLYSGSRACAASNTTTTGASKATMQHDGNFVVYSGLNAVWSSKTGGNPDYANGRVRLPTSTKKHPQGEARIQTPAGVKPQKAHPFWNC